MDTQPAEEIKEEFLVIFNSPNGSDQWKPVMPKDVPGWLKEHGPMGKLVKGFMATHPTEKTGWWKAEKIAPPLH